MPTPAFDYHTAFSRNIGWVTAAEQAALAGKRIAIAGLGGVGGSHLLTAVRMGIGRFSISDPDAFELVNFNRQAGASLRHLHRPKIEVRAELKTDIVQVKVDLLKWLVPLMFAQVAAIAALVKLL